MPRLAAFLLLSILATFISAPPIRAQESETSQRPNIILILADDMGYGDLGCYGHPSAKTPHIDGLAKEGVRFLQHYSNGPECSPTRTALLTGRYQQRVRGLECAIGTGNVGRYDEAIALAKARSLGLDARDAVIPGALRQVGYTCGVFGKWHLGYEPKFNPLEHGWDAFAGYLGGNVHYFNHRELSDLHVLFRGRLPVHRTGYMTHLITDDAINFIQRRKQSPFFLYVSHECPHFPFQGPGDQQKTVTEANWMTRDAKTYVKMLEDLDAEVGRLLTAVDRAGIRDNTLVVFVSDNGGFADAAHMGPLRGAKSTTLEGGIRVPLIVRWPKRINPRQPSNQVCITFDLTKSFLKLAQAKAPPKPLDGYDIIGHLVENRPDRKRTLFWRGKRGDRVWSAVRDGDLKFVRKVEGGESNGWLYDLAADIGETNDLATRRKTGAQRLLASLKRWESETEASRDR